MNEDIGATKLKFVLQWLVAMGDEQILDFCEPINLFATLSIYQWRYGGFPVSSLTIANSQ